MEMVLHIIGVFFLVLGWWQLDHFVAPIIWELYSDEQKIEIARLPLIGPIELDGRTFYVLCYISMFIGWAFTVYSLSVGT